MRVFKTVKQVVSYEDDVHVWVYFDQVDRVIRYETFVLGYNHSGEPTTLDFVLEEGVLDNAHEVPLFAELIHQAEAHSSHMRTQLRIAADGQLIATPAILDFYPSLTPCQLRAVHDYFSASEANLKAERRRRWMSMLHALGYDVLASLR